MRGKNGMHGKLFVTFAIVCVALFPVVGCKRTSNGPLARGWQKLAVAPKENAPILQQAAHSPCVWVTANHAGNIHIANQLTVRPAKQQVRLQTQAGELIGTNKGEYGGGLVLLSADGSPTELLRSENVLYLLPVKSGALVFTGLLHLSVEEGAVWLFFKGNNGKWSIRKLADLGGIPRAVYQNDGSTLVVTSHGISRIDPSLGVKELASLPLAQTHPNSVAEDTKGRIYIGMNAFVVRLDPTETGYASNWFTKPGCLR